MAVRDDEGIPTLINATRAAALLGCSTTWVCRLIDDGRLDGVTVGRQTLVLEEAVLAVAQERVEAAGSHLKIPPLVSASQAAALLGLAHRKSVGRLYRNGELPGVRIGRDLVFRREVVDQLREVRQLGYRSDPSR